jgi:hypothetical protein
VGGIFWVWHKMSTEVCSIDVVFKPRNIKTLKTTTIKKSKHYIKNTNVETTIASTKLDII